MDSIVRNAGIVATLWFLTLTTLVFQNCAPAHFESMDTKAGVIAKVDDPKLQSDGGTNPVVDQPPVGDNPPKDDGQPPVVVSQDPPKDDRRPGSDGGYHDDGKDVADCDCDKDRDDDRAHGGGKDCDHKHDHYKKDDSSERMYVCVLEGPGNSIKLGFLQNVLEPKNGTPQDVCMTEHACEDIVSQVFAIKGPAARGFCPGRNPHVVSLSDSEIQSYVDALK